MRASFLAFTAFSAASLVGCADPAPDQASADPASSTATAIVVVERNIGPNEARIGDAVIARFVRVRQGAVDDPALRIAGIAEDVPAAGACTIPNENAPALQGRSVELLDVGQVVLSSEDTSKNTVLLPRSMPDPAGVVSGVFYSARATDVFAAGSRVALRSLGGADLDGFAVSATAPREISDVRVTSTANGLDVSWDPVEADPRDVFYVDVLGPASRVAVRCTSLDANRLVIPSSVLASVNLPSSLEETGGQLAVHRLRKESFRAKGIEPGELRFDMSKTVNLRP